ncbi:GFA family protein, partial [Phenylobacterium sp.]|uniref:GFA family protein n=1 Tax=Phenylobacterium sp. TaxID=1871053 RepID=UPI002F89491E
MADEKSIERRASCACGQVRLRLVGAPILSAACCCSDCQAAGRLIEARAHAAPIRDEFGGTPYLIYRNDRFACVAGAEALEGVKISEGAPTTRYVATCCNSGMYLKFAPGWWTSVYRARVLDDPPPVKMRNKVASLPPGAVLPRDIPAYPGFPMQL